MPTEVSLASTCRALLAATSGRLRTPGPRGPAAYFAGLRIEHHQPHSFYIDRYPPGREATLDYPSIDLVWTNDTRTPVFVRATADPTSVTVTLYGDSRVRRVDSRTGARVARDGGGFTVTVTRTVAYRARETARQPYTTSYEAPPAER